MRASCARRSTTCAATSARCARSWSTSAACRRNTSSRTSRPTSLNLKWAEKEAAAGKPYSVILARNLPPVQELQKKLTDQQARAVVPLEDLKKINKRMNEGERRRATPRRR